MKVQYTFSWSEDNITETRTAAVEIDDNDMEHILSVIKDLVHDKSLERQEIPMKMPIDGENSDV